MKSVVRIHELRRSRACRSIAVVLSATLLLGQLRAAYSASPNPAKADLPDDRPWAFSGQLRPSALRRIEGATSDDALWNLFDSDVKTGISGQTSAVFEAHFDEPVGITSMGVFGAGLGHLSVKSSKGSVLAEKDFDTPRPLWDRLAFKDEGAAGGLKRLVVSWVGRRDGSQLPELEIWGRGRGGESSAKRDPSLPEGASIAVANEIARTISGAARTSDRTFTVGVNVDPRSLQRAFLLYRVEGVRAPAQIVRSLNGGPGLRGPVLVKSDDAVVEEISPRALKTGANLVTFHPPTPTDPVGYRVREVGVAWVRNDPRRAVAQDAGLEDGRESTVWDSQKAAAQSFSFEVPSQPHELEFRLVRESSGSLNITESGGSQAQIDLRGLRTGWHRVRLDALPVVADLRVTATTRVESPIVVSEMHVTGSPPPASESPSARVIEPQRGECVDHRVDLRALSSPAPVFLSANGHVLKDLQAEGDAIVASFPDDLVGTPGTPTVFELAASYRTGAVRKLKVHLEACMDRVRIAEAKPLPDAGAPFKAMVSAAKGGLISYKDATLEIPPDALEADTEITIRPVPQGEYHALDAGMVNVTARGQVFRFGPHNLKFKKAVRLTLPIDGARVTPGDDLETLYFDEAARRWQEIPKSGSSQQELASLTTHFTDFIASTLAIPAHPGVLSLNPTSIKDMKLSDPMAGVEMIAPPAPNSRGTASLSYPIIVPPGRKGMQPKLGITYSSDAKNGALGVGWNLLMPTVEVDTRFGVPRYQGNDRYLMNGQQLARLSAPPTGAPAGGTYFVLRNESSFNWIQRVDQSGGGYYWLVSDKAGTKYTYGQTVTARLQPNTSSGTPDPVRTARWFLEKEEDMWGNQVLYTYKPDSNTGPISGVIGSGDRYYQIYPDSILYTATSHAGPTAQYSVLFNYLGTRPDGFTDSRFGFLVYTQKLMSSVDVKNGGAVVRRYGLTYKASGTTDFGKSLLQRIQLFGKGQNNLATTTSIASHVFTYYTTPRDGANNYQLWSQPYEGGLDSTSADPSLRAFDGDPNSLTPNLLTSLANEGHHSTSDGTNGIAGIASVGVGKTESSTTNGPGFVDMNGDGLVDVMPIAADRAASVQAVGALPTGRVLYFGPQSQPGWAIPMSVEGGRGLNGTFSLGAKGLSVGGSQSYGQSSEASAILRDVNGDGFLDFVQTPGRAKTIPSLQPLIGGFLSNSLVVQLGDHGSFGPPVEWKGFDHQQLGFSCNQIFTQATSSPNRPPYDFPSVDPITRWTAPYPGRVRIGGPVQLMEAGGDGVVATLFRGNQKIWERDVQGTDTAACIPAAASPEPGSACSPAPTIVKTVAKGDRFYTRINAKGSTDHDNVLWTPTFEYIDAPASEGNAREAWGAYRYKFSQDTDSKAISADYIPWVAPETGQVKIALTIDKRQTSAYRTYLLGVLVRGTTGETTTVIGGGDQAAFWLSDDVKDGDTATASTDVTAGDRLYIGLVQSMPFDPDLFGTSALLTYTSLTRKNPGTGAAASGTPVCVPRSPELGADSPTSCTIGANDPDPLHPSDGEALTQYVPIQVTQRRWSLKPPSTPAPTPDGRKAVFADTANPILKLCGTFNYDINNPNGAGVIGAIQSVNKLLVSTSDTAGQSCITATSGIAAGDQLIFAVYSFDNPGVTPGNYTATINGQATPVEVYTIDGSFSDDSNFFSLGQADKMSGGMNGFSEGFWNGNYDFDESLIVATENDHYQRAAIVSYPLAMANVSGARVQFGWHSISHFVSKAAKAVAGAAKKVVVTAGSYVWKGVKYVGGIAAKLTAWSLCQTSDLVNYFGGPNFFGSYTVNGLSYAEIRSSTGQATLGPITASHSGSQTNAGLDLIDMNGDGIADDVSTGGIRYGTITDPATGAVTFAPYPTLVALPAGITNPTLRTVESDMYSTTASGDLSQISGIDTPQVRSDSEGETEGTGGNVGISFSVGKGYSRTRRQLVDMNGDGLPDIAESDPAHPLVLKIYFNYGYGFGKPVDWSTISWMKSPQGPEFDALGLQSHGVLTNLLAGINSLQTSPGAPDSALQLDEVMNSGDGAGFQYTLQSGYVNYEFGASVGLDANYVMNFTRLVDVNGDGLPDHVYKAPGEHFFVKINTGTGFQSQMLDIPTVPWPTDFYSPLNSMDAISYRRGDDTSLSGHGTLTVVSFGGGIEATKASGGAVQSMDLLDIDGDGLPDHVAKSTFGPPGVPASPLRASEMLVRYNQAGKGNLLMKVTNPIGGGFTLDYSREGNFVGSFYSGQAWNFDMQSTRWCLASVTTFDNFQNSYTDTIQYDPLLSSEGGPIRSFASSGFYDRGEKEFYGFSHVRVIHGDGTEHMFYYRNDLYQSQGTLIAEYESDENLNALRGSVDVTTFVPIPNATPSASYVQRVDHYDERYLAVNGQFQFYAPPMNGPDGLVYHPTIRIYDSSGNLATSADLGDAQVTDDDVWFQMSYQSFSSHFTPVTSIVAADKQTGGSVLRQRDATYTMVNGRPTLSRISDTIIGGNQPTTGTPYVGSGNKTVHGFTFDSGSGDFGNLKIYTDPSGATLTYGYDSTGTHITSITDNLGYLSSATMNMDFGVPLTTTDENNQAITFGYDAFGRTTDVWGPTDPTAGTPTVHVDYSQGNAGGVPAWAVTKNKDVQSTSNDTIDLVTMVDGLGRTVQTKKEAEVSADGNGGATQVMLVSGPVLYDVRGRPITENDPVAFTFDPARETAFETVGPANTITYAYDGIGRLLLKTYPGGATEQHIYVPTAPGWNYYPTSPLVVGGRALEAHGTVDPIGVFTLFYSDGVGRRVAWNTGAYISGVWTSLFNFYQYDRFGNVAAVFDTKQNATTAAYDSLNRMVTLTSPDAGMTEFRYGTNGLLAQKQTGQLRLGTQWINYVYDTNSTRLKTIDYPSMPDVTFAYGLSTEKGNGAGNIAGRIKAVTMEGGTEQRTYDAFGNIAQTNTTLGQFNTALASPTTVMKYSYDWMGRMQSMTFPNIVNNWVVPGGDGEVVSYVYDKGGNLKQITGKATPTSTPEMYLTARTYNSLGQLAVDVAGNGVVTTRSYLPTRHWLTGIATATTSTTAPFQNTTFTYRSDGMLMNAVSTSNALAPVGQLVGTGTTVTTYDYDHLHELISSTSTYRGHATFGYQTQSTFGYDAIGNMVSKTQTDTKQTFADAAATTPSSTTPMPNTTYGLATQYSGSRPHAARVITETTSTSATVTHNLTYDMSGRHTGEPVGNKRTLIWDEADRLKEVDTNGVPNARFKYNADGERTQRQDASGATTFYFNQFLVIHGNQYVTKQIFGGTERLVSKTEATSLTTPLRHFYHSDQVGSTSYITDAGKNLVQHERYFPFGERWAEPGAEEVDRTNGPTGTLYPRNWLFTSKELDTDTGYYYYGARYYDARNARWLSPDPILASYMKGGARAGVFKPLNLGLYTYAWNNPILLTDRDGTTTVESVGTPPRVPVGPLVEVPGGPPTTTGPSGSGGGGPIAVIVFLIQVGRLAYGLGQLFGLPFQAPGAADQGIVQEPPTGPMSVHAPGQEPVEAMSLPSGAGTSCCVSLPDAPKSGEMSTGPHTLGPNPKAEGTHTTFKRDPVTGKVSNYETFQPQNNPRDPTSWESTGRFDGAGKPHFNKVTGTYVPTPHVQGPGILGGVRPAEPGEIP